MLVGEPQSPRRTTCVTPPFASPYRFSAALTADGLAVAGVLPDEPTRQALIEDRLPETWGRVGARKHRRGLK